MSVLYNDSRALYDQANLTYNGTWLAPATGAQPSGTGQVTTRHASKAALSGIQSPATSTLTTIRKVTRAPTGAQASGTGTLAVAHRYFWVLSGTQNPATATLVGRLRSFHTALSGAPSPATALLTTRTAVKRTLTGAQPYPTAALVGRLRSFHAALTGAQSTATALLTTRTAVKRTLTGAVASGLSGLLTNRIVKFVPLSGSQPYPTGTVAQFWTRHFFVPDLAGAPDASTGQLQARTAYHVSLAGAQPAATGQARGNRSYYRTLTGTQPIADQVLYDDPRFPYEDPGVSYDGIYPSRLTYRGWFARQMAGDQPAPVGDLDPYRQIWPWATYSPSVYDRPEVCYVMSLDADDLTIRYETASSGSSQGLVYREIAPRQNREVRG